MPTKEKIIQEIQDYVYNTYLNDPDGKYVRVSLDNPARGPIKVAGEWLEVGRAYAVPGFLESVLEGIAVAGGVYGEDRQVAASATRVTNGTNGFIPYLQLNVPAHTGTYEVRWHCVVDSVSGTTGQVRLNSSPGGIIGPTLAYSVPSGHLWPLHGEADIVFAGAAKTFTIEMRDLLGTGTQGIQDLRIEIKRVA